MKDYKSIHIKLIAMLHCRLQHNHKSSTDFTHATDTHANKILHTPRCSGSYLFQVVLRHHSDSSAVYFTVTVLLCSVYKYCSSCSSIIATYDLWAYHLKECLHHFCLFVKVPKYSHTFELPLRCMDHTHTTLQNLFVLQWSKPVSSIQNEMHLSGLCIQHISVKITMAGLIESGLVSHQICYLLDVTLVACLGFSLLWKRQKTQ